MNRDFVCHGTRFHLNDAKYHNEFTPKYLLVKWNVGLSRWTEVCHVGSKKEAKAYVTSHREVTA